MSIATNPRIRLGALAEWPAIRQALDLLDKPGSRHAIPTPAAIVDLTALRGNLERAAEVCRDAGVALRPHAKTHKCADLARLQLAAGAVGVCVAKVGEAEALFGAGIDDILVTSPIVGRSVATRVADLAAAGASVTVTVDHPAGVTALAAMARTPIDVLVDVDVGLGRSGAPDPATALRVAAAVAAAPQLTLRGVQGYGGHWQHICEPSERHAAVAEGMQRLTAAIELLDRHGHDTTVRTGGGTGTLEADIALGVLTELQPGSYAVMDAQYHGIAGCWVRGLRQALFVAATVTGATRHWLTVDAGLKAFATDAGVPVSDVGAYLWYGDEQGLLLTDDPGRPALGTCVEFTPPHCDPTIDRYDLLHVVEGDTLVDLWPVQARGRSQ
ncbi:alanine racemase [Nocardia pneumoniae]|uniref:alanine racemase n=1 Tax=Nocardia pneumoniae TaxID=228601 RepID=UPI0002E365A7|nr:alanine racemase [Nocardia pneumoniae]